jgi:hypothetical protein
VSRWLKRTLLTLTGAGFGYSYYFFVGCATGSCPISSNPLIATAYGALIGAVLSAAPDKESTG